jgi:hypothetical protein
MKIAAETAKTGKSVLRRWLCAAYGCASRAAALLRFYQSLLIRQGITPEP